MEREQFDLLFRTHVIGNLAPHGFQPYGKNIGRMDEMTTICLMRYGGRWTIPGGITHSLVFRHSFLRNMDEVVPTKIDLKRFAYPYEFRPAEAEDVTKLTYRPLLSRTSPEGYSYREKDETDVVLWAQSLVNTLLSLFLPWASTHTPRIARDEIRAYGNNDWCERLWLEDYDHWLKRNVA